MPLDKDLLISAQNAATAASSIYSQELANNGGSFDPDRYEEIRQAIANGSLAFAGSGATVTGVPALQAVGLAPVAAAEVAPGTWAAPAPSGGGSRPHGDFVINFGKHRGKTLAAIANEDESYLDWVAQNGNNEFAKKKVIEFLAAA